MVVRHMGARLIFNVPLLLILAVLMTGLAVGKAAALAASLDPEITRQDLQLMNAQLDVLKTQLGIETVDRIKADASLTERLATLDVRLQNLNQLLWMLLVAFVTNIAVAIRTWMMYPRNTRRANNESRAS